MPGQEQPKQDSPQEAATGGRGKSAGSSGGVSGGSAGKTSSGSSGGASGGSSGEASGGSTGGASGGSSRGASGGSAGKTAGGSSGGASGESSGGASGGAARSASSTAGAAAPAAPPAGPGQSAAERRLQAVAGRLQGAYVACAQQLGHAWDGERVQMRLMEEQQRYLCTLQETGDGDGDPRERGMQALHDYAREVRETLDPGALQRRFQDAFRTYVASLREVWTELKPTDVDPATLAVLAQATQAGVQLACESGAAVQQRAMALSALLPPELQR